MLDDQMCDECQGARCGGKFAPFFCANVTCLQYYCEFCWANIHSRAGREFLNARLEAHGTDSQQVYITTVSNAAEPVVTFSQDLNALGNDTLEWGNVQIHDTAVTGCFSKHWVYDEAVRVSSPSVREVEALMQELLAHAKEHWNS